MSIQKQKTHIKFCCHVCDNTMLKKDVLLQKLESLNCRSFRADQIMEAVYKRGALKFSEINNIPERLKNDISQYLSITTLTVAKKITSSDESAVRYLLKTGDGYSVETVLMSFRDGRNTVCVSSQIGCRLGCRFCATGRLKFGRDLTDEEICEQALIVLSDLVRNKKKITNVVFMGMGEPLMNYENMISAVRYMNNPEYFGIGARNITISTAGIVPGIKALSEEKIQINLAVSLHAPSQKIRESIMPVAKMYDLNSLMDACDKYVRETSRRITYEYIMLKDINDKPSHALELSNLLKDKLCHVNLIPYNATGISEISGSERETINNFAKILEKNGIAATVRVSLGQDIYAACGQLANKS